VLPDGIDAFFIDVIFTTVLPCVSANSVKSGSVTEKTVTGIKKVTNKKPINLFNCISNFTPY
jgi:hypothetical protein